jgi:hypothetical protein
LIFFKTKIEGQTEDEKDAFSRFIVAFNFSFTCTDRGR